MRLRDLLAITDSYTKIYIVKHYNNDVVAIRDSQESTRLDLEIIDNNFSLEQIRDAKVTYMFAFSADKKDLQACLTVDIEL